MSTNGDAYSESFSRLKRAAALHANRLLSGGAEADDVVQEALLRAYLAWDEIADYAEAWVGRVSINLAIGRLRRRAPTLGPHDPGADPSFLTDTRVDLARAIDVLPRRQRQVVVLRYVADLPLREIGQLLEISTGSVKRHLHRALTALRDPSAGLSGNYRADPPEETFMTGTAAPWQAKFRRAIEPAEGWPPGPWDHRWFDAGDGRLQRLACDHRTGAPILDGDGDEVRTGPGMDFVLVKADDSLSNAFTPWDQSLTEAPLDRLDATAHEVLDRAVRLAVAFSGGNRLGVEHLAMALLDLMPEAERWFGIDAATFRKAVAALSDGPHADARLALVEQRLSDGWTPNPVDRELPMRIEGLSDLLSEAVRRADYFGSHLPDEESTPLVRAVDLLHLITDPGERYSFVRSLIESAS